MNFIGNQKMVSLLASSLKSGKLSHAYLFAGPERTGKFTLAKLLAINLIKGEEQNFNDTDLEDKNALLDMIVLAPEIVEKNSVKKQRDISIEAIREAKSSLSLFPYHGKYKVLIINDAHKMNIAAQNGLLKILEEPNLTTVIILVTHEPDKILPTIFSRCQMHNFGLVNDQELAQYFSRDVAALALGRPGYAVLLSKNEDEKEFASESLRQLELILKGSLNEKLSLAEQLSKNVVELLEKINLWLWELRKRALLANEAERRNIYLKIEKIQKDANVFKKTNANARLVLETLFMDL